MHDSYCVQVSVWGRHYTQMAIKRRSWPLYWGIFIAEQTWLLVAYHLIRFNSLVFNKIPMTLALDIVDCQWPREGVNVLWDWSEYDERNHGLQAWIESHVELVFWRRPFLFVAQHRYSSAGHRPALTTSNGYNKKANKINGTTGLNWPLPCLKRAYCPSGCLIISVSPFVYVTKLHWTPTLFRDGILLRFPFYFWDCFFGYKINYCFLCTRPSRFKMLLNYLCLLYKEFRLFEWQLPLHFHHPSRLCLEYKKGPGLWLLCVPSP